MIVGFFSSFNFEEKQEEEIQFIHTQNKKNTIFPLKRKVKILIPKYRDLVFLVQVRPGIYKLSMSQ